MVTINESKREISIKLRGGIEEFNRIKMAMYDLLKHAGLNTETELTHNTLFYFVWLLEDMDLSETLAEDPMNMDLRSVIEGTNK